MLKFNKHSLTIRQICLLVNTFKDWRKREAQDSLMEFKRQNAKFISYIETPPHLRNNSNPGFVRR